MIILFNGAIFRFQPFIFYGVCTHFPWRPMAPWYYQEVVKKAEESATEETKKRLQKVE